MLYELPDVRYVDMCIYIDKHAYDENPTEEVENTIFQYLYFLCHMFASKGQFFDKTEYYDDFSIYAATQLFMRLRNPKQFEFKDSGERKVRLVKSILNYIKKTIDPLRIDFQQLHYSQIYQEDDTSDVPQVASEYCFCDMMSDQIDALSMVDFNCCLGDIIRTTKVFLKQIPYYSDKKLWNNIYISCLLSFLNSVTLSEKDKQRLGKLKRDYRDREAYMDRLYMKEADDSTILFHLDESMHDYITVLTRELKHAIAKDLSISTDTYISGNSGIRVLIEQELRGGLKEVD